MHPSAAHGAGQLQPIGNWAARPRQNQGLGTALLVLGALVLLGDILEAVTAPAAVQAFEAAAADGRDPAQVLTAHDAFDLLGGVVLLPTWIVGSLWLSRARENAVLIAPDRVRRSAVWAWLGWWVPIVSLWFPMQIVDDSWRITSSVAAVGQRGRYRNTSLWWGLWVAYNVARNVYENRVFTDGIREMTFRSKGRGPRAGDRRGGAWRPGLCHLGARGPRPVPGPNRTGPAVRVCWPGLSVERECALAGARRVRTGVADPPKKFWAATAKETRDRRRAEKIGRINAITSGAS